MTEVGGRQRILVQTAATLRWTNLDQDGAPAEPAGAVTVAVERSDGTEVIPATGATPGPGTGERSVQLTAAQNDRVDALTATWTDAGDGSAHVTQHEVVGGFLFSEAEGRSMADEFADTARYPKELVLAVRRQVESAIEGICGRAFVPRFKVATLDGEGDASLWLDDLFPRVVRSASVGGVALTAGQLADLVLDASGEVRRRSGYWARGDANVVVAYEYGDDLHRGNNPVVKRAGLELFKAWLPGAAAAASAPTLSGITRLSVEGLSLGWSSPTTGDSTGVDAVDRLIQTWRGSRPVLA